MTDEQFTEVITFEPAKIESALRALRARSEFPPLFPDGVAYSSSNRASVRPIPKKLAQSFEAINRSVFGKPGILELKACAGCEPNIEVGTKTVYLDPVWIDDIYADAKYAHPNLLLEFILAHEAAHYVYESHIMHSPEGTSPHGQASYWQVRIHDQKFADSISAMPKNEQTNEFLRQAIREDTARHAEIDAIGLVILARMGRPPPCDALTWLRGWTSIPDDLAAIAGGPAFLRINSMKAQLASSCLK